MQPEQEEQSTPHFADHKKGGVGPVLGIIVIIILLALGGLYYFTTEINNIPSYEVPANDESVQVLQEQSSSDVIADIEADVNATDLSEIDALLDDLDADASAQTN